MQSINLLEIKHQISEHNPFLCGLVDKASSVWSSNLPDLTTHNHHIFDILDEVLKLLQKDVVNSPVQTLLVLAPVGMGKTQIFSRIRKQFFEPGKILFSYINAGQLNDSRYIHSWLRKGLVRDFLRPGISGVNQWQEIAAYIIRQTIQIETSPSTLIKKFDGKFLYDSSLFSKLHEKVLKLYPTLDPYVTRALLWTLSERYSSFVLKWLAGDEIDQTVANVVGLPSHLEMSPEKREVQSIQVNPQILQIASLYKPLVIGFDELEDSNFLSEDGFSKKGLILDFVKKIYESVELIANGGNGILVISAIVNDDESVKLISDGGGGVGGLKYRISTANNHQPVELNRLNSELSIELLKLWLQERLYNPLNVIAPDPLFPFTEEQIHNICKLKPTPREFLKWCAGQFKELTHTEIPARSDSEIFKDELFEIRKTSIPCELLNDSGKIAELLQFGFFVLNTFSEPLNAQTPNGEVLSQLEITQVSTQVPVINPQAIPKVEAENYLDFKITGKDSSGQFCIGVGVSQSTNSHTIRARLKRLSATERFGFTRSCLVRSKDLPITGKVTIAMVETLKEQGGEVVSFTADELEPLWHIYSLKCKADIGEIEFREQHISNLILECELDTFLNNSILLEILSSVPPEKQTQMSESEEDDFLSLAIDDSDDGNDDDNGAFDDLCD